MLVSQIVTMLALGVVMRGPDLGLFLLCQSIAQTFSAVATLRFDSALPAARSRVELGALLVCAGAATLMSSALVFLLALGARSEEITSELKSHMRISSDGFCLNTTKIDIKPNN